MKQLILALCTLGLALSPAFAALDLSEVGVGARPLSLGRAYVALADDASAIFTNPAGLSRNNNLNLISMSGMMLGDIGYVMVGAADNSPLGKFGIGYINASVGGIPITTMEGSGASLEAKQTGTTDYSNSLIYFSYGSKLSRFLKNGAGDNWSLGGNLKIFSQGFTGGGTAMQNALGGGLDADLGLLCDVNSWLNFGFNFQNFLPSSFGGKFVWQKNSVTEGIPMVIQAGVHGKILGLSALKPSLDQRLDVMLGLDSNGSAGRPNTWHAGLEYWPLEMFSFRVGLDQKPKATEAGSSVDNNLTAGLGLMLGGFTFDYAYHQFGDLTENTTHFFSIGYRGEEKARERLRKRVESKNSTIPQPELVAKPSLKTFADVPNDYWAKSPIEYCATLGIIDGYPDDSFKPTQEISRADLAVMLVKAKGFAIDKGAKTSFSDVPSGSDAAPYISLAVERKYLSGYKDGTFRPDQKVTRADAATILARFSGIYVKPKVKKDVYADVTAGFWAAPAVAATKETGMFEYITGPSFGPEMPVTRAEAAEMLVKTPAVKAQINKLLSTP